MLNVVTLVGNLGQDVEVRYTQSGAAIANMSLAVNEHVKNQETGEPEKRTHWFKLVAFNRTAEIAAAYLRKGSKIGISGTLVTRQWTDKEGAKRDTVEIRIAQLEFLETRPADQQGQQHQGQQQRSQQSQSRPPAQHQQHEQSGPSYEDDSSIPF
jgi:single-strand DNA-binding protein